MMKRCTFRRTCSGIFLGCAALLFVWAGLASALPRFALMEAEGCHDCHANPAGAGLRTEYGTHFGIEELSAVEARAIDSQLSEHIQIGGDLRTQLYAYFDAESDDGPQYAPSAANHAVEEGSSVAFGGFMMQTDLYAQFMLSDRLRVYIEQDMLRNTREAYGLYGDEEAETYVKAGVFMPNYGLRIDDHTAFMRGGNPRAAHGNPDPHTTDGLFWYPNRSFKGVEVGSEILEAYVTLGAYNAGLSPLLPDNNNAKALLARAEWYLELGAVNAAVGGNAYVNKNEALSSSSKNAYTTMFGAFGGVGNDRWTLMANIDLFDDYLESQTHPGYGSEGFAFWSEASVKLARGLYLIGKYERFDPDADGDIDEFARGAVEAEWYPIPYLEIKSALRLTDQPYPADALRELLIQTHLWF